MEFHPFAEIFPLMDDDDLQALADDIRQHGQRETVVVFEGQVLDGRNRATACVMAGKELKTREFQGSRQEAVDFVWSVNEKRRHLKPAQRESAALKREDWCNDLANEAKEAKRKDQSAGGQKAGRGRAAKGRVSPDTQPNRDDSKRTTAKVAETTKTSPASVARAKAVKERAPDLFKKMERGEMKTGTAYNEMKKREKSERLERKAAEVADSEEPPDWKLIHGDVMDGLQMVRDEHGPARLIFADPPYNQGVDYGDGPKADRLPDAQYMMWAAEWINLAEECLAVDGGLWVMICDEYAAEYNVALKAAGFTVRAWIKWYETFGVNCTNCFNRTSRHLFYCVRDAKHFVFNPGAVSRPSDRQEKYSDKRANPSGKIWDDVWTIPRLTGTCDERLPGFPTQLPLGVVQPVVECASEPGDLVVDPFSGSATTGVACIRAQRTYIGIEKSKTFIDASGKRLAAEG